MSLAFSSNFSCPVKQVSGDSLPLARHLAYLSFFHPAPLLAFAAGGSDKLSFIATKIAPLISPYNYFFLFRS